MTSIEQTMRAWLADPDPVRRQHAERRIAIGFDGAPEPSLPSLATQAVNLARATARHVAGGLAQTDPETLRARLETCRGCAHLVGRDRPQNQWRCGGNGGCGCYVQIKAEWAEQACPRGYWPE